MVAEKMSKMCQSFRNRGGHICSPIGSKNSNVVKVLKYLLCFQFHENLCGGRRGLVISDTCATGAQTAAIYKYYEYVYSIHEEKCRVVLQTKCIKENHTGDALHVINNFNSSILRCDIDRSPRVQPFPENVTYFEPTTLSGKGNPNNEENRDNYCNIHGTTPVGVIHTSYGVILSVLAFILSFAVFKICKMRSELQKLQDFKLSKQPNVRFVKPAKVSLKFTKKEEIRVISASSMETVKPEGNDGNESTVIYALPNKSKQRCSDVVHDYACPEFDNMPRQTSLDSKVKETREQYDDINTYEELSQSRDDENVYLAIEIDKTTLKGN
ncbi:hypothetical protein FSP39_000085 [Pinctada imbricata]|uniref:Uncharacterized protein n=1 Tax=Pinctada imbricata TaxID=66713 RepID=A0AA89BY45_PINIB|nr:hypothetical protein FSP39_000085 [Pinctada imbricata]